MKRVFLSLSAIALAATFNACEGRSAATLPDSYNSPGQSTHSTAHKEEAPKAGETKPETHPKAAEHPNPAGEAKPN